MSAEFSVTELALAYRKAKADIFFDTGNRRLDLAEFESGLETNLQKLTDRLHAPEGLAGLAKDREFLGGWTLAPAGWSGLHAKNAEPTDNKAKTSEADLWDQIDAAGAKGKRSVWWVDPLDEWRYDRARHAGWTSTTSESSTEQGESPASPTAEFRVVSACSVEFHIVSALWIRRVGEKLERQLGRAAIGRRLRRTARGNFNEWANGSFPPYLKPYREWQLGEYEAIERELKAKRPVVAVSADFSGFFHHIDAGFLLKDSFFTAIGVKKPEGRDWDLHVAFVQALRAWACQTRLGMCRDLALSWTGDETPRSDGEKGTEQRGLPVGMAASAVIANLALHELDEAIERDLKPVYYGRYVDDLSIVLRDGSARDEDGKGTGSDPVVRYSKSSLGLWKWIESQIQPPMSTARRGSNPRAVYVADDNQQRGLLQVDRDESSVGHKEPSTGDEPRGEPSERGSTYYRPEYLKGSTLKLNAAKSSQIHLSPGVGESLMRALRRSAGERSSEWRMLPDVPQKAEDVGADILRALTSEGEETDALRTVDGLRARRAAFALRLRDYSQIAEDTELRSMSAHLDEFLRACRHHIVHPEGLLDYWRYVLRLFAVVVQHERWEELRQLLVRMSVVVHEISKRPTAIKAFGREHGTPDRSRVWSTVREGWAAEISEVMISAGLYDGSGKDHSARQFRKARLEEVRRAMRCLCDGHVVHFRDADLDLSAEERTDDIFAESAARQLEDCDLAQRPLRQGFLTESAETARVSSWVVCGAGCHGRSEGVPVDLWELGSLRTSGRDAAKSARNGIAALVAILGGGPGDGAPPDARCVTNDRPPRCAEGHPMKLIVSSGLMFPTRPFAVQELIAHALPRAARWEDLPSSGVAHEPNKRPSPAHDLTTQFEQKVTPGTREAARDTLRSRVQRAALFGRGYVVDETLPRIVKSDLVYRGTAQSSGDDAMKDWATLSVLQVGKSRSADTKRTFALAVVDVPPEYLKASAMGMAVRTLARYRALTRLVNDALSGEHTPAFIVFPELSVPHEWFTRFAAKLAGRGVGMIAGVDFLARTPGDGEHPGTVRNEVWMSLPFKADDFPGSVIWRQPKLAPAPSEAKMLRASANLRLDVQQFPIVTDHLVIENNGFRFSVLNCAELADVTHRARLRGHVDALVVPEYNQDIGSFNALVEAASLDIHAFVVQCNVRKYGDTRIRAPYAERWRRDVVQIKGGTRDLVVRGDIDFGALRRHQSEFRAEPEDSDSRRFKPCPGGFRIAEARRMSPVRRGV